MTPYIDVLMNLPNIMYEEIILLAQYAYRKDGKLVRLCIKEYVSFYRSVFNTTKDLRCTECSAYWKKYKLEVQKAYHTRQSHIVKYIDVAKEKLHNSVFPFA
jgi:hypothetical protein